MERNVPVESDYRTGCWNFSHCTLQSCSGLHTHPDDHIPPYLYMYMYCLDKYLYTSLFFYLFWFCKYVSSINTCLTTACLDYRCSSYCRSYQLHEPPCCQRPFLLSPWSKRWGRVGEEPVKEVAAGSADFCKIYPLSKKPLPLISPTPLRRLIGLPLY